MANLAWGQSLTVTVTGIRSSKGNIRLAFYTSAKNFKDDKPLMMKTVSKAGMKDGTLSVTYKSLSAGLYGVALLDDENADQEMNYYLLLPTEGFGFSDYYHTGMSHPSFDQFDFYLKQEPKTVKIRVRYM